MNAEVEFWKNNQNLKIAHKIMQLTIDHTILTFNDP